MGDPGSQLPYGLDQGSIKPGAVRSMTSDKLASFSLGTTKKTPFQKHQEAKAAKRKAEEEAAKAEMAQWVETFESAGSEKKFVRGGVIEQGNPRAPAPPGGGRYGPPRQSAALAAGGWRPDRRPGPELPCRVPRLGPASQLHAADAAVHAPDGIPPRLAASTRAAA